MAAIFHDSSFVKHDDTVAELTDRQSVADDQRGRISCHLEEFPIHFHFEFCVYRRVGFIERDKPTSFEFGSRERYFLPFTTRKIAAMYDIGVKLIGSLFDYAGNIRSVDCFIKLVGIRLLVKIARGDIIPQCKLIFCVILK